MHTPFTPSRSTTELAKSLDLVHFISPKTEHEANTIATIPATEDLRKSEGSVAPAAPRPKLPVGQSRPLIPLPTRPKQAETAPAEVYSTEAASKPRGKIQADGTIAWDAHREQVKGDEAKDAHHGTHVDLHDHDLNHVGTKTGEAAASIAEDPDSFVSRAGHEVSRLMPHDVSVPDIAAHLGARYGDAAAGLAHHVSDAAHSHDAHAEAALEARVEEATGGKVSRPNTFIRIGGKLRDWLHDKGVDPQVKHEGIRMAHSERRRDAKITALENQQKVRNDFLEKLHARDTGIAMASRGYVGAQLELKNSLDKGELDERGYKMQSDRLRADHQKMVPMSENKDVMHATEEGLLNYHLSLRAAHAEHDRNVTRFGQATARMTARSDLRDRLAAIAPQREASQQKHAEFENHKIDHSKGTGAAQLELSKVLGPQQALRISQLALKFHRGEKLSDDEEAEAKVVRNAHPEALQLLSNAVKQEVGVHRDHAAHRQVHDELMERQRQHFADLGSHAPSQVHPSRQNVGMMAALAQKLGVKKSMNDDTNGGAPQLLPQEHIDAMEPMERGDYFKDHTEKVDHHFGVKDSSLFDFDPSSDADDPRHSPDYQSATNQIVHAAIPHMKELKDDYKEGCQGHECGPNIGDMHKKGELTNVDYHAFLKNLYFDHEGPRSLLRRSAFPTPVPQDISPIRHWLANGFNVPRTTKTLSQSPRSTAKHLLSQGYEPHEVLRCLTEDLGQNSHEALEHVLSAREQMKDSS